MAHNIKGDIVKSRDWKHIEECIASIKMNDDMTEDISRIERTLTRIFDIEFKVVVTPNTTGIFYGINVFPFIEYIDKIAHSIINNKTTTEDVVQQWQKCPSWYIEIDSLMINDITKPFNASDVASLMIHEIARIVYTDKTPVTVNNIFRYNYAKFNFEMRALMENDKIRKILDLVIIEACSSKMYNHINIGEENDTCNDMVVDLGYLNDYNNVINKILKLFGSSYINRTSNEYEKDIGIVINWAIENIRQLEYTKGDLKDALRYEMLRTNSYIVKQYIEYIYNNFFGGVTSQYRVLLSEQYTNTPSDVVSEIVAMDNLVKEYKSIKESAGSRLFDPKTGKIKKISQLDIDVISVDADRIETADDKIYLLDRVYTLQDIINTAITYIDSPSKEDKSRVLQSKSTLLDMKKQLDRIRERILTTRIVDKQYGVFIKYPKGYEH